MFSFFKYNLLSNYYEFAFRFYKFNILFVMMNDQIICKKKSYVHIVLNKLTTLIKVATLNVMVKIVNEYYLS